ncbi:hypothetical protein JX265_003308 [Neoarthrinium moseri]|uniref:HAD-like protein n=1 Tax=Neoarthrinium moseri TaxID=1658444 RepID=A0A9Q0AT65_9PEZI|nr:hypothetical protein JX265_003308 [Neoarthrinium moseri]
MTSNFKALVFDLGGVLLNWDRSSVDVMTPNQFLTIMNSTTWHNLDRGLVTLKEACVEFGHLLGLDASTAEAALEQAQLSLTPNTSLIETIHDLRASNPSLKFYVMSNISREHFEIVQRLNIPWSVFDKAFASGVEGMRKPDLCFFEHVIKQTGVPADQIVMIDDTAENICAARSKGMHGILVDKALPNVNITLRNMLQDPLPRAQAFLKNNAGSHHCTVEGHEEIQLKDNFAQLMIWELTDDEDIIYLKWPNGRMLGSQDTHANGNTCTASQVEDGLWNYFFEAPILTTRQFPPDADTTSTAYLSLPKRYLSTVPPVELILDEMAANSDSDGIMQTYFDPKRPRVTPEVCCNILRVFHSFGHGSDPRIKRTEDYVVECLNNNACLNGNRHYSTPESFLYFVARLYAETNSLSLRKRLKAIKPQLQKRLDMPANPLALALRLFACQSMRVDPLLYQKDLERLLSLQEEDGGWPAGHFCCIGRTGARIGNRGLTTALVARILQHEKANA